MQAKNPFAIPIVVVGGVVDIVITVAVAAAAAAAVDSMHFIRL